MAHEEDRLEQLFALQAELNDNIFRKKDIRDHQGRVLTMETLKSQARAEAPGPNSEVNQWLGKFLDALDDESRELRQELLWKWWSKDTLDMQNIRVEIIDQLHFWISLALSAGIDAQGAFEIYMEKNRINHERQEKGYSRANKNEGDNAAIRT